jgi:transposase
MRGQQERPGSLFSYVSIEDRIPASHPLRRIRRLADQALDRLDPTFCQLYPSEGRPSVPPEQLLLAALLQAFYGIRSERLLLEQLDDNLLFRWFVGLSPDDPIWHRTTYGLRPTAFTPRIATGCSMSRCLRREAEWAGGRWAGFWRS